MSLKITVEELFTCNLGGFRERTQQSRKLPLLNLGFIDPLRMLDRLLDLR
jgi:hypothetical protein